MPGEAKIAGHFTGWTAEETYAFVRDSLKEEASRLVVQRPPTYIEATQGRGRFQRRFEATLERTPEGILLRGRITSPEDWPVHIRRAFRRFLASLGASVLGVGLVGVSIAYHLDDWPIVVSLLLFSGGATAAILSRAVYANAKRLNQGRELPFWLGSSGRP